MTTLFGLYPFLLKLYADGGYQGHEFQHGVKKAITRANVEIVRRSDQAKGFVVLPKRSIVERAPSHGLVAAGRLACLKGMRSIKDWECLNVKALVILKLASNRLMIRRLCNPP